MPTTFTSPNLFTSDAEIDRIGLGFLDLTLPKPEWTHAAHFAAALWLLRHRPGLDLAAAMPGLIRRYNTATGVENSDTGGYHETITLASLRAARAFAAPYPPDAPLHEALSALMASPLGAPGWLEAYWSKSRLTSVEARRRWVEPDLKPLPF
jgi:hypothetical protein